MASEDSARALQGRLNILRDADPELVAQLESERAKQTHRHGQLSQLTNRIRQWLTQLPAGTVLEPSPPLVIEKSGTDLSAAISNARTEIAVLRGQLVSVKAAPLPQADQSDLVDQYVASLMRAAKPDVRIVGDRLRVGWRGDTVSVEDTVALIALIVPEQLARAIERQLPERPDAMPAAERVKRVAELERTLLELERKEEGLIAQAATGGLEILRRPDASVLAVLGCEIAQTQAQVA